MSASSVLCKVGCNMPPAVSSMFKKLFGVPGWAAAQNIWYLQDLNAVIIDAVFPDLLTQRANDWLAEPGPGRRADEVAEFYFVHRCAALRPIHGAGFHACTLDLSLC